MLHLISGQKLGNNDYSSERAPSLSFSHSALPTLRHIEVNLIASSEESASHLVLYGPLVGSLAKVGVVAPDPFGTMGIVSYSESIKATFLIM